VKPSTLLRVLGAAVGVWLLTAAWTAWQLHTVTDVDEYEDVLQDWDAAFVEHFPPRIPAAATSPRLSYFAGFLQGGAHLQLRLGLPPADVARVEQDVARLASPIHSGGEGYAPAGGIEPVPLPPFHTADTDGTPAFPAGYTFYVLSAEPGTTESFPWNHGRTAGVVVSVVASEVVYWAESW